MIKGELAFGKMLPDSVETTRGIDEYFLEVAQKVGYNSRYCGLLYLYTCGAWDPHPGWHSVYRLQHPSHAPINYDDFEMEMMLLEFALQKMTSGKNCKLPPRTSIGGRAMGYGSVVVIATSIDDENAPSLLTGYFEEHPELTYRELVERQ